MSIRISRVLLLTAFAVGAFLMALDGIKMLLMLFDPDVPGNLKEWLGYGAILGTGWAFLLLVSMVRPFDRKYILLITLFPVLGSILTNNIVHHQQPYELWYYWFCLIGPGILAIYYLFVYFFAHRDGNDDKEGKESEDERNSSSL